MSNHMRIVRLREAPKGVKPKSRLTKDELAQIISGDGVKVVTPLTTKKSLVAHTAAVKKNADLFGQVFKDRPDVVARLKSKAPGRTSAPIKKIVLRNGRTQEIRLLSSDAMIRSALGARTQLASPTVQAAIYRHLYQAVSAGATPVLTKPRPARAVVDHPVAKFSSPALVAKQPVGQIVQAQAALLQEISKIDLRHVLGGQLLPHRPACADEEGAGTGGDRTSCDDVAPAAHGLLGHYDWPLKAFTTCVRNQGNRGTCAAFALCAAVESRIAVQHQRWLNLSEQDLYKHWKYDWCPWPIDFYGDGYDPELGLILQWITDYVFPFESSWDYNPSFSRTEDDRSRTYAHSCDGYGEACSETNHQAHQECHYVEESVVVEVVKTVSTWVEDAAAVVDDFISWVTGSDNGHWVEETVTEFENRTIDVLCCTYDTATPGTSGFCVSDSTMFYDFLTNADHGLAVAKTYLDSKVPCTLCLHSVDTFSDVANSGDDAGYVTYDAHEQSAGDDGHCVFLTGYCDNAHLPAGAPQGSGGGYFIIKNSWSTNWGDAGYAYLPYDWVKKWATEMVAINSVSP